MEVRLHIRNHGGMFERRWRAVRLRQAQSTALDRRLQTGYRPAEPEYPSC